MASIGSVPEVDVYCSGEVGLVTVYRDNKSVLGRLVNVKDDSRTDFFLGNRVQADVMLRKDAGVGITHREEILRSLETGHYVTDLNPPDVAAIVVVNQPELVGNETITRQKM